MHAPAGPGLRRRSSWYLFVCYWTFEVSYPEGQRERPKETVLGERRMAEPEAGDGFNDSHKRRRLDEDLNWSFVGLEGILGIWRNKKRYLEAMSWISKSEISCANKCISSGSVNLTSPSLFTHLNHLHTYSKVGLDNYLRFNGSSPDGRRSFA